MDGPTDRQTDKASYRDAWTHLKRCKKMKQKKEKMENKAREKEIYMQRESKKKAIYVNADC